MYDWPRIDWHSLRDYRVARTRSLMDAKALDHVLFTAFDNIRYVTDYRVMTIAENHDWFAALVDRDGQSLIFVPFVDEEVPEPLPALPRVSAWVPAPSWSASTMHVAVWARLLAEQVERVGARRIGVDTFAWQVFEALRERLPNVEFVDVALDMFELRVEKHPAEIELLEAVSRVNAIAAQEAIEALAPGMRDFDVLAVAMESLQRQGVEYLTHSVCNVRQPSGAWFANGAELRDGDAFFFDIGAYGQGGYASDICRTAFVGDPRPEVVRGYEVLLEAYRAAQDRCRPGVSASEVHEAANAVLVGHGYPRTPYAVGHGIGLRACEWPTMYRPDLMSADVPLVSGATIALEPETVVEIGGESVVLKIEDNFLVTDDGLRMLSEVPHGPS